MQSSLSTALPIGIAVLFGTWSNRKRLDAINHSLDRLDQCLDRLEAKLANMARA